jgi:hypothetical protein
MQLSWKIFPRRIFQKTPVMISYLHLFLFGMRKASSAHFPKDPISDLILVLIFVQYTQCILGTDNAQELIDPNKFWETSSILFPDKKKIEARVKTI